MKQFEFETIVSGNHLDIFGHVNNAVYLQFYEMARWDFIEKNGYGLSKIVQEKKGPVILDLNLSFKSELRNRDRIKILSWPEGMKNKLVIEFHQKMMVGSRLASQIRLNIGFFDLKKRKLLSPTENWLKALGMY